VALVGGIFGAPYVVDEVLRLAGGEPIIGFVAGLWSTMMWGGLGGVVGAFYSLYWHVAKVRDFDRQYTMWYVVQPVIGLLVGSLVHLLIGSGFLTGRGETQAGTEVAISLFPYAVAAIAGFRQRFILEMIDRVIQVITPSPQPESTPDENEIDEEPLNPSQ
jgi:H+/Cl- antiporter ClcA